MAKEKRIPRKDLIKTTDLTIPVNVEMLGGKDDPCFGKHFNPATEECQRCGDSEICCIVLGQMNTVNRKFIEKEHSFKDLEEDSIPDIDKKVIRKKIKARIREIIRMAGGKGISEERIIADVHATFVTQGFSKARIKKILDKLAETTQAFTFKNSTYKWKS
jgi:hypothetical protein